MAASGRAKLLVTGAAFPRRCACHAMDSLFDGHVGVTVHTLNAVPLQQGWTDMHRVLSGSHFLKKKKISTSRDNVVNFKIKVNACELWIYKRFQQLMILW